MNVTQFLSLVRSIAQFPDSAEDLTDDYVLSQATQALYDRFIQPIITLRNGTWLHKVKFQMVPNQSQYMLPSRSIVQGLERFEIAVGGDSGNGDSRYRAVNVLTTPQTTAYEDGQRRGQVFAFSYFGAMVEVYPTPSSAQWAQFLYYLRPPALALAASFPVTAVTNPSSGVYRLTIANTALLTQTTCDLQHTLANSEVIVPNLSFTVISGTVIEVSLTANQAAQVNTTIVVNNPEVSSYIALPQELANSLVSYTVAVCLGALGDASKAGVWADKASTSIKNVVDVALPRSKSQPSVVKTSTGYLRNRLGGWGWGGGRGC